MEGSDARYRCDSSQMAANQSQCLQQKMILQQPMMMMQRMIDSVRLFIYLFIIYSLRIFNLKNVYLY